MMAAFEDDEDSQKRGIVGLMYFMGENSLHFDRELHTNLPAMLDWLPVRVKSLHLCTDNHYIGAFKPLLMATMGRARRVRLRIHDGAFFVNRCVYSCD